MNNIYIQQCATKAAKRTFGVLGIFSSVFFSLISFGLQIVLGTVIGFDLIGEIKTVTMGVVILVVTIIIGFIVVFIMSFIWELQSSFVRVYFEPKITRDIENDKVYIDLLIENQEPVEIKNTCITIISLSRIFHFPKTTELYDDAVEIDRLRWESKYADELGRNTLPLNSKSEKVRFAVLDKDTHKIKFAYNSKDSKEYNINQLFLLKLRLDGMVGDKNIAPKYFDGYFFPKYDAKVIEGVKIMQEQLGDGIEKIQKEKFQNVILNPIIAFDAGDWRKNEKIPDGIKNYKILPAQYHAVKS